MGQIIPGRPDHDYQDTRGHDTFDRNQDRSSARITDFAATLLILQYGSRRSVQDGGDGGGRVHRRRVGPGDRPISPTQLQTAQGHPSQSRRLGKKALLTVRPCEVRTRAFHARSEYEQHARASSAKRHHQCVSLVPLPRHRDGHQTPMGSPPRKSSSRRHKATFSPIGPGFLDMGNWAS